MSSRGHTFSSAQDLTWTGLILTSLKTDPTGTAKIWDPDLSQELKLLLPFQTKKNALATLCVFCILYMDQATCFLCLSNRTLKQINTVLFCFFFLVLGFERCKQNLTWRQSTGFHIVGGFCSKTSIFVVVVCSKYSAVTVLYTAVQSAAVLHHILFMSLASLQNVRWSFLRTHTTHSPMESSCLHKHLMKSIYNSALSCRGKSTS